MDFNAGSSVGRRWAKLLAASGQLHGRHWAGSHGRRHAAADPAECERFCATVNLRMTARDDGNGWVTDLASQDRSHRTLTGVLVLSLWTEPAEGDDGAS